MGREDDGLEPHVSWEETETAWWAEVTQRERPISVPLRLDQPRKSRSDFIKFDSRSNDSKSSSGNSLRNKAMPSQGRRSEGAREGEPLLRTSERLRFRESVRPPKDARECGPCSPPSGMSVPKGKARGSVLIVLTPDAERVGQEEAFLQLQGFGSPQFHPAVTTR